MKTPMTPAELAAFARDAKRALLRKSFRDYVVWAWPLITGTPYVANTITEAIIATLQRVADGELIRVLIACPPGVGKSTLLACYASWRLARNAGHRSIHAGHSFELARDESLRVRRLIEGDAYRAMFANVALRDDQNTAGRWATTQDGRYIAIGTDGGLTGIRAHEAVLDDPLNAIDRFSTAARESLWRWFLESLSTRLDGDRAPVLVIQQRLDRDDLIGKLIEAGGWHLVGLPAETDDGELLAPNVLPREKLDALKAQSASTYACQYKQRPSDDSTSSCPRSWWRFHRSANVAVNTPRPLGCNVDVPAVETPTQFSNVVIACDLTFGGLKAANDFASIQVWGSSGAGRYLLAHWRRKATQLDQQQAIRNLLDEYSGSITVLVENAAGGQGAVELLRAAGFSNVIGVNTGGKSKDQRFSLVSPTIEAGNAYLPLGANWLGDFVEELAGATKHDDAKDACAYALARLSIDAANVDEPVGGVLIDGNKHTSAAQRPSDGLTLSLSPQPAVKNRGWSRY